MNSLKDFSKISTFVKKQFDGYVKLKIKILSVLDMELLRINGKKIMLSKISSEYAFYNVIWSLNIHIFEQFVLKIKNIFFIRHIFNFLIRNVKMKKLTIMHLKILSEHAVLKYDLIL